MAKRTLAEMSGLLLLTSILVVLGLPSSAFASGCCYFDGGDYSDAAARPQAVNATISYDYPYVSTNLGSAAWVGIQPPTSENSPGLVQAGWAHPYGYSCTEGFYEFIDSSGSGPPVYTGCISSGSSTTPEVYVSNPVWNSSNQLTGGTWYAYVNYVAVGSTTVSSLGWTDAWQMDFVGEENDGQTGDNQSPGAENAYHYNPVEFSSVQFLDGNGAIWETTPLNIIQQASWQQYDFSSYSTSSLFYIWDDRPNSNYQ